MNNVREKPRTRSSSLNRIRPYAQLIRLPNVFTALADIGLGILATAAQTSPLSLQQWTSASLLLLASACLYCGGMVWNDYFDIDQDTRERPFRPLPSGRVTMRASFILGTCLLVSGIALASLTGWVGSGYRGRPVVLAGLLAAAILLYDSWLKTIFLGPVGMGLCRFLNVLLGLSLLENPEPWHVHAAAVVGIYIVGVTWFARTEARVSSKRQLAGGALVALGALVLALPLPEHFPAGTSSLLFPYALVLLGFALGFPMTRAISRPSPAAVQIAVKRAIFGLVFLDAILAMAVVGSQGLVLIALLIPAHVLGRWIYST